MLAMFALPLVVTGLLAFTIFNDDDDDQDAVTPEEPVDPDEPTDPEEPVDPEADTAIGDLVTVTADGDMEIPDDSVIFPGRDIDAETSVDNVVTPPEGPNDIAVGYDPEISVLVEANGDTQSVDIHLNSNVAGVEGAPVVTETEGLDENGIALTTRNTDFEYDSSMAITVNVGAEEIGVNQAIIDLTNPNDTLNFQFGDDVSGNLHLVRADIGSSSDSGYYSESSYYVIHTEASVTELAREDIYDLLYAPPEETDLDYEYAVLSEVRLGYEQGTFSGSGDGAPYSLTSFYDLNDDPVVTTNTAWSSITQYS